VALVAIVPNFSEGRRSGVIDEIVAALCVPGARLLYRQADPDHNRLDTTLAGEPEAMRSSALAGAAKAAELIDMRGHKGSHPRMGALDVLPFVPVRDVTMDDCVALARATAREIGEGLEIPVYCYGEAALVADRRSLADVRRGEYEALKEAVDNGERLPDFGPHRIGRAGATAVGARKPLVAFNVYLTGGEDAAREIAKTLRESSGGLPSVRAIGFAIRERGCVTVSMNLTDYEIVDAEGAFDAVAEAAGLRGIQVLDSEIVGLVPRDALPADPSRRLLLRGFDPATQIFEDAVEAKGEK
jgi:glutamate formiminotransferase